MIAAFGGLLTVPEIGQATLRLAVGVQKATDLKEGVTGEIDEVSILALTAGGPVGLPEPMANPFCEFLDTPLGHALARCPFADDAVRNAELLINAACLVNLDESAPMRAALRAGLALIKEVATRCKWTPYEPALGEIGKVAIPSVDNLMPLLQRVTFSPDDLNRLCGADWRGALSRLTLSDEAKSSGVPLEARPLVPSPSGGLIVARPDVLAPALAYAVAQVLVDEGEGRELNESFQLLATERALASVAELGARHHRPVPAEGSSFSHVAILIPIDADVLLHLLVLPANLETGASHTQHIWQPVEGPLIPARLDGIEERIRLEHPMFETVIHLVILEGGGALPILKVERPPNVSSPCLVLTGAELEWIARNPDISARHLIAFAHDATDLRTRVTINAISQFDEFATWHSSDSGLLSIEAMAQADGFETVLLTPGPGTELRDEVLDRYSPRIAPAPDAEGWVPVARHLEYQDVDIWRPWAGPDWPPHMFVPRIGRGVWVLAADEAKDQGWNTRRKWTELIAYWLWHLRDELSHLTQIADTRDAPLVVQLDVEVTEGQSSAMSAGDTEPFEVSILGEGLVSVVAHAGAADFLGGSSAEPEHQLIREVIHAISASAGAENFDEPTMPAGLRKLVYINSSNPAVRPVPVPEARIHPSYRARAYRSAGNAVKELGFEFGSIEENRVNDVLHAAVGRLFSELEAQVIALDRVNTVPVLVSIYERLLHTRAVEDIELVAIDEFFGHNREAAKDRQVRWQELMGASVTCRFVLELMSARPPEGKRLPSDNRCQELLATALTIIELGRISDLVRFELTDNAEVSLLPPGLLRAKASDVLLAEYAFTSAVRHGDVTRSGERRATSLGLTPAVTEEDDFLKELEIASLVDHGYTIEDLAAVVSELIHLPENQLGFTEGTRAELLKIAQESLDEPERAEPLLEAIIAGPRKEFLNPPRPYKTIDVFPWRNNRQLSYLRKPLIAIPSENGERLIYGRGACFAAIEFLIDLAVSGRLGEEGSALRDASSQLQQREARDFEHTVADVLTKAGWRCRRRVKKLSRVHLARENGEALGDIDVLAAHSGLKLLVCFEAKALSGALAPNQLRNELDATFAPLSPGKRSAAVKFVERVDVVHANLSEAVKMMVGESDARGWRVGMSMVTDQELLSPLLDRCPSPVLSIGELRAALASGSSTLTRKLAL